MTDKDFDELCLEMEEVERKIRFAKGNEYSHSDGQERLGGFKRIAEATGIKPSLVGYVFLRKHMDSIANYIKKGKVESNEGIQGRFHDARNYLLFIYALILDEEEANGNTQK